MSETTYLPTLFAPAERAPQKELKRQAAFLNDPSILRLMLDAVPDIVLVLNEYRQMIYCNQAMLRFLMLEDKWEIIGLRPGELLDCIHSAETEGGCGTTEFCRACGAVRAILSSLRGLEAVEECRITTRNGGASFEALDLRVWATPFEYQYERFVVFAIVDISDEKRKSALERIFFHDILNVAAALKSGAELLARPDTNITQELSIDILQLVDRLVEEIEAQRDLIAAENKEFRGEFAPIRSLTFLQQIVQIYANHYLARERAIFIDPSASDITFINDATLLRRVIGNMLKNALEACKPGETVTIGCQASAEEIQFWVHNPGYIPREAQLQIFQRSFSTKDKKRGLGTYSMKLLSERYLGGQVSFTSSPEEGTRFTATYTLQPPNRPK